MASSSSAPVLDDAARAVSTAASSVLMEDAISSDVISVRSGAGRVGGQNQMALFANPFLEGKEEALAIDEAGELTYLRRTGDGTGWKQEKVPSLSGAPIAAEEVVVIVHHRELSVWALYSDHQPVHSMDESPVKALRLVSQTSGGVTTCQWQVSPAAVVPDPTIPAEGNSTGVVALQVNYAGRKPWVFGMDQGWSRWVCAEAVVDDADAGRYFALTSRSFPGTAVDPYAAAGYSPGGYGRGQNMTCYYYAGTSVRVDAPPLSSGGLIEDHVAALVGVYTCPTVVTSPGTTWPGCVYLDFAGANLCTFHWYVDPSGQTREVRTRTPGLGFKTAQLWLDVNQMMHVYGVDASGTLQVVHQTDWTETGAPVWSQAQTRDGGSTPVCVGVHPRIVSFALDPFPDYLPSVLVKIDGVSPAEQFCICTQDITTARWSMERVRLPSDGAPHLVRSYISEVKLLNSAGGPVPNQPVSVSADSLVEIQCGGASYLIGPGHTAQVTSDTLGRVTLKMPASTLAPPPLHVDAVGLAHGAVIQPAADLHNFLAGTGTLSSQPGRFDVGALKSAQADGQPITHASDAEIKSVVDSTHAVFATANGQQPRSRLYRGSGAPPEIHGLALSTRSGSVSYVEFGTPEAAAAHVQTIRSDGNYGGIWEDFVNFSSDVWEGLKNGVIQVTDVVVTSVVKVFIQIGQKIVELVDFLVDSVISAVHAVEAIFRMVVDAIGKVLDWLKALFDFRDIWDTKTALESAVTQLPRFGKDAVHELVKVINADDWFQKREQDVTALAQSLRAACGTSAGVNAQALSSQPVTAASASGVVTANDFDSPQANWMMSQLMGHPPTVEALTRHPFTTSAAADSAWEVFVGTWNASGAVQDFLKVLNGVVHAFQDLIDVNNPESLLARETKNLIDIVEGLVKGLLKTCDALYHAVLTLIDQIVDQVAALLNQKLQLGFVNSLYTWFHDQAYPKQPAPDMTVAGLFSLVAAFPVTVIYKLIMGTGNPPFPGGKLRPKPWPASLAEAATPGGDTLAWLVTWGIIGIFYTALDIMNDVIDMGKTDAFALAVAGAVLGGLINIANVPAFNVNADGTILFQSPSGPGAWGAWASWALGWILCIVNVLTAFSQKHMLRNVMDPTTKMAPIGAQLVVFYGFAQFFFACIASANLPVPLLWKIGNAIQPLSSALQFLRVPVLMGAETPPSRVAFYVKGFVVNGVADAGGNLLCIIGSLPSAPTPHPDQA